MIINEKLICDTDLYGALSKSLAYFAPTPYRILLEHSELDDFLQVFMIEASRHWHKRNTNDFQEFHRFAYFYARRQIKLKKLTARLISIRAIDYTKKLFNNNRMRVACDTVIMENLANRQQLKNNQLASTNNPYLPIVCNEELIRIKSYLENTNCSLPIVKYFELLAKQYEYQEIVDYFGLSKKATSKIQEALRYYLNKYMGQPRYKSIYEEKRKEQESKKIDPVSILEVV